MREIEVKARLKDKATFLNRCGELGIVFSEPVIQDDTTYETDLPKTDPAWNIFRIRKAAGKTILTMKYKASDNAHDNHERETEIQDAEQVADMLARVGYSEGVNIYKSRQLAKYEAVELCIDEVKYLGDFVEVEKLTEDDTDPDTVQAGLWSLLEQLGVSREDEVLKGYDRLMHEYLDNQVTNT